MDADEEKCIYCGSKIDHNDISKHYCTKCEEEYNTKTHDSTCNCNICFYERFPYY